MRFHMLRPALIALMLAATSVAAHATEKQVYRLDSVTAVAVKGGIQIQAKGAVNSGGWTRPRLKVTHVDARTVVVEFLAQLPTSGAMVITGLIPVSARVTVKAGHGVTSVRAEAEANDITAQVLR
jgi:hypothetical protein